MKVGGASKFWVRAKNRKIVPLMKARDIQGKNGNPAKQIEWSGWFSHYKFKVTVLTIMDLERHIKVT